jgi:tetratricopeptide (TPR) repeat protein
MMQRLTAEDRRRRARLIENRSLVLVEVGRFEDAESGYQEALALRRELGGSERSLAMVHNNYGNLLAGQRRFADALQQHEQALSLRIGLLGLHHPDVAMSIVNIARLHLVQYRYAEGLARLAEGEKIIAETLGEDSSMMATTLNMKGIALLRSEDIPAARAVFERALAIRIGLYGANHIEVGESWNTVGAALMNEGDYPRAEAALLRARAIFEAHGPTALVSLARARANLGSLAARRGEYALAERVHREALAELELALGADNPELVSSLQPLALALLELGRPGEALPFVERALRLQRIADDSEGSVAYIEFLRLRAEIELGRAPGNALAKIARLADQLRGKPLFDREAKLIDAWLASRG